MLEISHFVNDSGDLFLSRNPQDIQRLSDDSWSPVAAQFRSLADDAGSRIYRVVNQKEGFYRYLREGSRELQQLSADWVNEGTAFRASARSGKGLQAIHELFNASNGNYAYAANDSIIGEMLQEGYQDRGISWYSPTLDGDINVSAPRLDPVTGMVRLDYSMDALHLSQFRNTANQLSFRLFAEGKNPADSIGIDLKPKQLNYSDIEANTGLIRGTLRFDADAILKTRSLQPFKQISVSINAKYGQDSEAGITSYGFVRSASIQFQGRGFQTSRVSDSGGLESISQENLYLGIPTRAAASRGSTPNDPDVRPGGSYSDIGIINKNLPGVDWSGVRFYGCSITGNTLTGANLKNVQIDWLKIRLLGKDQWYATNFWDNNLKGADIQGLKDNVQLVSWQKRNADISDARGSAQDFSLSVGDKNFPPLTPVAKPSIITLTNRDGVPVSVNLESPQFKYGPVQLNPGQSIALPGYGEGSTKDITGSVRRGNQEIRFGADNPLVDPAYFFVNDQEQDDDGQIGFLAWDYSGDDSGMKEWSVKIQGGSAFKGSPRPAALTESLQGIGGRRALAARSEEAALVLETFQNLLSGRPLGRG